jgi:YD repeat-containing protein
MSILNIKAFLFAILTLSLSEWAGATTYTYDNLNRLTAMAYTGGGSQTYTYDTAGNLLSMETTAPPASNYTLTLNRLGTGTGTVAGSGMNCGYHMHGQRAEWQHGDTDRHARSRLLVWQLDWLRRLRQRQPLHLYHASGGSQCDSHL